MVKHHLISKRAVYTNMALITILLLSSIAHGGGVSFVDDDAPPGGDGNSWDSAYRFIADAFVAAGNPEDRVSGFLPDELDRNQGIGSSFHQGG